VSFLVIVKYPTSPTPGCRRQTWTKKWWWFSIDLTDHQLGVALTRHLANPHIVRQAQTDKDKLALSLIFGGFEFELERLFEDEIA